MSMRHKRVAIRVDDELSRRLQGLASGDDRDVSTYAYRVLREHAASEWERIERALIPQLVATGLCTEDDYNVWSSGLQETNPCKMLAFRVAQWAKKAREDAASGKT